eukprot:6201704-Pleurochrysis_carterae.AAC.6
MGRDGLVARGAVHRLHEPADAAVADEEQADCRDLKYGKRGLAHQEAERARANRHEAQTSHR